MADERIVYSMDGQKRRDLRDLPRESARRPVASRPAVKQSPTVPNDGVVRLFRERGGRGGKVVTVIHGLRERGAALDQLAVELKRRFGAGGAVKERVIEVQGDHRDTIAGLLRERGYTVKLAGG